MAQIEKTLPQPANGVEARFYNPVFGVEIGVHTEKPPRGPKFAVLDLMDNSKLKFVRMP